MLGPVDPCRSKGAEALLPLAHAAAQAAGVTRLADLTRLDRVGLPVWQAVRPDSRALSVHQGKGATDADAQLGALLEAVESHWAEQFDAPGPLCAFADLPPDERPASLADFAAHRTRPPGEAKRYRWVETGDLLTGRRLHLPFEVASLDFTRDVPSRFDRASNGVATGATEEEALRAALHELVERDGVVEWQAQGLIARTGSQLRAESVPFPWFHLWMDRLGEAGVTASVYLVPSVTASPLFLCELRDWEKAAGAYRSISGRGCHPVPEIALYKALTEAIQGRATYIAGAREDLLPYYRPAPTDVVPVPYGLPLPDGMKGISFDEIAPGPSSVAAFGEALARAGFAKVALLPLARLDGLVVMRAFVYGLGSMTRRREAAA